MPTSIPLQPTITTAGLAAIFNAQSTGVEFELSHIAFGTAQYVPDGSETGLRVEKVRVPIAGGGRISPTQIQIYAVAMAAAGNPFFVGEVGFFGDDGATLLAVYSSTATPSLFLSDTVSTSVSYALGLAALPANSVTVTIDPSASAALLLIGNHVAAPDPHPQYVEKVNGIAFYDPTITFDLGAQIIGDDLLVYQSIQAANINHAPSSSPTWWVPLYNYGDTPVAGLTNANVTLSSTQAARAHITFSGALTAPINIVFPNWVKDWTVVNSTTGAFSLTCKTAAGTGVVIPQNSAPTKIRGDGTNITQLAENVAVAADSQHPVQFAQIAGVVGSVRNLAMTLAAASATATVTADEIIVESALGGLRYCLANFNKTINLATVGVNAGVGGMDTGTASASSFVGIYAIWNPVASTAALLGVSASGVTLPNVYGGANMPAGYTASALLTVVPTNASSQIVPCVVQDRSVDFVGVSILSTSTAAGSPTIINNLAVPLNAKTCSGFLQISNAAASSISFSLLSGPANTAGQVCALSLSGAGSLANSFRNLKLSIAQRVYYIATNSAGTPTFAATVSGYEI